MHALISDIRKLYYQCVVEKSQQDFLRFLWYRDNDFTQLIVKNKIDNPFSLLDNATQASVATIITAIKNFYIDDGLFSFPSEAELIYFFK